MTRLYVYSLEDNAHVATINGNGNDNVAMENKASETYDINDYGFTYSPAFGTVNGLVENPDAVEIDATPEEPHPAQSLRAPAAHAPKAPKP